MQRETITTKSGKTVLVHNGKYRGRRTLPILYLHGGPGSFVGDVVDLIDYDGPVYSYAQFGCGGSDEKEEYTPELFVEQLREVIEHGFKDRNIVLAGASWGGTLALLYIDRFGTEGICGLALLSPAVNSQDNFRTNSERKSKLPEYIKNAIEKGNREGFFGETYCLAYRGFFSDYYGGDLPERAADWCFEPSNDVYVQMWGKDESECTGCMKDMHLDDMLGKIDIPVLYISGDRDLHSVEDVRRYCSMIDDVELHILDGVGHSTYNHPDYDRILKDFVHRVDNTPEAVEETYGFSEQEDYDMILSESSYETPEHLIYAAGKMSLEECAEEARRHETGDGRPQSYLSAALLYRRCNSVFEDGFHIPFRSAFGRQYDARDAERRLILSPRGMESYCCSELRAAVIGYGHGMGEAYITYPDHKTKLEACPFCGKDLEFMDADRTKMIRIADDEEFIGLKERYLNEPMTMKDAITLFEALKDYSLRRESDNPYTKKYSENLGKYIDIQKQRVGNVTGRLTASSAGLESVCCGKLRDNLEFSSAGRDRYYMRIRLKDSGKTVVLKICPYCGERLKRVPRTY